MGELTRWQPMVSLYTYFTDCPRKEGGPSMGSVSQYESARSTEQVASQGQKEAPAAATHRLPAPRVRISSGAELGMVLVLSVISFPEQGKHIPSFSAQSAAPHITCSVIQTLLPAHTTTHTNSASKECERCKIQEHKHIRAKLAHNELNLNLPLCPPFACCFHAAVTGGGLLPALPHVQRGGTISTTCSFRYSLRTNPKLSNKNQSLPVFFSEA